MKKGVIAAIILAGVILVVGGFLLFGKISPEGNNAGEIKTILHKDFRASINSDWEEIEVSGINLYLPQNTSQEDDRAEAIVIISTPLQGNNQTLDQILEQGIENSKIIMPDFELTENINYNNGKITGKEIKFTGTQQRIKRNGDQFFGIKNNILYSVTYTCPSDSCNYDSVFRTVIESFEPV